MPANCMIIAMMGGDAGDCKLWLSATQIYPNILGLNQIMPRPNAAIVPTTTAAQFISDTSIVFLI